jgi:hypothetical protein
VPQSIAHLAFLLLLGTAAPAAAQSETAYDGIYAFAGGESQRSAFTRAIDEVVEQMNVVIRGIARQRISARVKIQPRIVVANRSDGLFFVHEPLPPRLAKLDGTTQRMVNAAGDRIDVTYTRAGSAVIEAIRSGRSSQRNTYRFAPAHGVLTFTAEIESPMMPGVIRYSLTYRRRAAPGALAARR